jgi:predicted TPR repeat methyltransferase
VARASYERYLELAPGDPEVEHVLAALRDEAPPARASDRCIVRLYERFAGHYDESMCGDLGYAAPDLLAGAIAGVLGGRRGLAVLDLGCGTGLAGARLRPYAGRLVGIDLSPEMLRLAERRGLYDALEVAEITEWLGRDGVGRFDLIASCDTLIYFGDLGPVLRASAARLAPGGGLALTVERGDVAPFRLADSGRFTHHPDHIRAAAREAGLTVTRLDEAVLRQEYGEPVVGLVAALRRPSGGGR